jgi:uncharacterized protein with FMN-binding domain
MRRSTAAAVGTLTGAALIVAVRLSAASPAVLAAAPPTADLADSGANATPSATPSGKSGQKNGATSTNGKESPGATQNEATEAPKSGLSDGSFKGKAVNYPYGTIQVFIKVSGGQVSDASATYPITNNSATINPPAIATLKAETLKAQSAHINAVSGATYTSQAYVASLQAALDTAKG